MPLNPVRLMCFGEGRDAEVFLEEQKSLSKIDCVNYRLPKVGRPHLGSHWLCSDLLWHSNFTVCHNGGRIYPHLLHSFFFHFSWMKATCTNHDYGKRGPHIHVIRNKSDGGYLLNSEESRQSIATNFLKTSPRDWHMVVKSHWSGIQHH